MVNGGTVDCGLWISPLESVYMCEGKLLVHLRVVQEY